MLKNKSESIIPDESQKYESFIDTLFRKWENQRQ